MGADRVGESELCAVRDVAALVGLLRELKQWSGLSLRELEERARCQGEFLARSTVSDMLRGKHPPAPGTLAAFVRACGAPETDVRFWLAAARRAEEGTGAAASGPAPGPYPSNAAEARRPAGLRVPALTALRFGGPRRRPRLWMLAAAVATGLVAVVVRTNSQAEPPPPAPRASPEVAAVAEDSLRGYVEIRPARTPQLCLSEGRDTRGEYVHAVAAQLPCEEARPPHTYLRPVDTAASRTPYFIEWQHPVNGRGCLTLRREGPGKDLLEPWPARSCDATRTYQHFRIEPVGPADARFRIRQEGTRRCVGLRDDATESGADVTMEPCNGATDQEFLIRTAA
ncbi:helix-turn-helix domain-containing protein [Streptomyces sp. NPDC056161]|uniref:helix-turn-helix domain-containing protein n=1 Tax=Streptomyces sp. NPDC056161 TaxID=3345732 RepID=UPI0035DD5387